MSISHFGGDHDDPVILHREDLVAKRGEFGVLRNAVACKNFNDELLQLVTDAPFRAFAVVLDKLAIQMKHYGPVGAHPYHIGLLTLLERYCGWLGFARHTGDVLAESRATREDLQLKAAYRNIYSGGTRFRSVDFFQKTLTTKEIKIKPKSQNICGIQLADLLAYPAKRQMLFEWTRGPQPTGFTKEMADLLEPKYNRRFANGQVAGYGKIFIG